MGKQKIYHQSVKKIWNLKGPQKLKFFCQMCEKQCRDEHGFKAHCTSESHQKNMINFAQDPTKYMEKHSSEFHAEFMSVFSTRYRDKKIDANRVYQEVISNREHTHINSTRWMTLTGYVKYLGQSGLARVEETERGFDLQYIDKSQIAEMEAQRKRALIEKTEEERERKALQDQVEKAQAADEAASSSKVDQQPKTMELCRDSEKEPIRLQLKSFSVPKKDFQGPTKLSLLAKGSGGGVAKKKNPLKG